MKNSVSSIIEAINEYKELSQSRKAGQIPIDNGRYSVCFYIEKEEDWGYMGMRDYKTMEPTGQYALAIFKKGEFYNDEYGMSETFDGTVANKIYYNLKHREYDLQSLLKALKSEGIKFNKH